MDAKALQMARIAFLHPDLGLGAERLIVDAAIGLLDHGHSVTIYTSHYDPNRCFAETHDSRLRIVVAGDWIPRHFCGKFHILFATWRAIWLALFAVLANFPISLWHGMIDVFICDQISAYVPVLQLLTNAGVIFTAIFPTSSLRGGARY